MKYLGLDKLFESKEIKFDDFKVKDKIKVTKKFSEKKNDPWYTGTIISKKKVGKFTNYHIEIDTVKYWPNIKKLKDQHGEVSITGGSYDQKIELIERPKKK